MTIRATLSEAEITIEHDARLTKQVLVRLHARTPFVSINESDTFRKHVERCSRMDDAALIDELRDLRREQQTTNPTLWALWFLTFVTMPSFLLRLHLRAGEMRSHDPLGAKLRQALAHASAALGFGKRGKGRARKQKESFAA